MIRNLKIWLRAFARTDAHPFLQFVKYGLGGVAATVVHFAAFRAFDLVWPVHETSGLSDAVRARHFAIDNLLAFLISNLVAYLINVKWVFKAGRHKWWIEVGMFYAVSGLAIGIGTCIGFFLISCFSWGREMTWGANVVAAVTINFVLRKFVIFKG